MFRTISFVAVVLAPLAGWAGSWPEAPQCTRVYQERAELAAKYLPPGTTYVEACDDCGEITSSVSRVVLSSEARPVRPEDERWELVLNGKPADLTHLFVRTPDGSYRRVSSLVGCYGYAAVGWLGPTYLSDTLEGTAAATPACTGPVVLTRWLDKDATPVEVPSSFTLRGWDPPGTDSFGSDKGLAASWTGDGLSMDMWHVRLEVTLKAELSRLLKEPLPEPGCQFACLHKVLRSEATKDSFTIVYASDEGTKYRKVARGSRGEVVLQVVVPEARAAACKGLVEQVLAAFPPKE